MTRAVRWAAFFLVGALALALLGEPRPLALATAVASLATAAVILGRAFDEQDRDRRR